VAVASGESSIGSKDLDQTPTWGRCLCLHCFHLDILNSGEKPSRSGNGVSPFSKVSSLLFFSLFL